MGLFKTTRKVVILRGAKRSRRIHAAVDEDALHGFRDFARNDMERRWNDEAFEVEMELRAESQVQLVGRGLPRRLEWLDGKAAG